jgi:excisionase family DNA binding protein
MVSQKLRPQEVAELFGVGRTKVMAWIASGELRAVNVATRIGASPRFVIDAKDIEAFERRRQVYPEPSSRRVRQKANAQKYYV